MSHMQKVVSLDLFVQMVRVQFEEHLSIVPKFVLIFELFEKFYLTHFNFVYKHMNGI